MENDVRQSDVEEVKAQLAINGAFVLLGLVATAVATVLFTLAGVSAVTDRPPLLAWGITITVVAVAAAGTGVVRDVRQQIRTAAAIKTADDAAADAETALAAAYKEGLEQLADAIAEMPHLTRSKHDAHLRMVAKLAVDAVNLLGSQRVPGMRANVFELTPTKDGLRCVESTAKRHPADFTAGEDETDEALAFLNSGDPLLFYPDLSTETPKADGRRRSGYETFMSLPIAAPIPDAGGPRRNVYGMLTVDAPAANSFAQRDVDTAELVADILATAFAIVEKAR
ncbi:MULTISPECIES: hypothetical protein [unclassified Agromyces]|uniref:hypothetical protein n=1 Tax=unclassified Agromyces TaxID=2639701 RepID=UPI003014C5AE